MKRLNTNLKLLLGCFIIVFVFLTSCRSKRQEIQKVETTTEMTKENIVSFKDTIVYAPKSETSLKIPISDLTFKPSLNAIEKPKIFTQKNGNATAKLEVAKDFISVTATCDSLAIIAKIKTKLEREYRLKEIADQSKTDTKTGYTFWDIIIGFVVGFVVGFIVCFVLKLFRIV